MTWLILQIYALSQSQLAVLNLTALHTIPGLYSTQFKCNALECTVLYRNALHCITHIALHFTALQSDTHCLSDHLGIFGEADKRKIEAEERQLFTVHSALHCALHSAQCTLYCKGQCSTV